MEFYVVKDLVQIVDLRILRVRCEDGEHPEPYLHFDLKFPKLIEPGNESESTGYFVRKVKEVVEGHYDSSSSADVYVVFTNDEGKELNKFWIQFHLFGCSCDCCNGFEDIFSDSRKQKNVKLQMVLSLCHLPTKDTPVSPDALFTLTKSMEPWGKKFDAFGFRSDSSAEMEEIRRLWSYETGCIYSKLSVVAAINDEGVKVVMDHNGNIETIFPIAYMTREMCVQDYGKDLELKCGNGKIVKAHSACLRARSTVFNAMLQASDMEEAKTGRVNMEEMSEEGVRAFLKWIYYSAEKDALMDSDVAVELLIAGDKYNLEGLVGEMETIILHRRGYNEEWFSVESAVELYRWAKIKDGKDKLRDKAVGVLNFFGKTVPENLVGSKEYQELIKNESAESTVSIETPTQKNKFCVIS